MKLFFLVLICAAVPWPSMAAEPPPSDDAGAGWTEVLNRPDLRIATREKAGFTVKEVRAVGRIDAPTAVVRNVLADAEDYPQFMPYTKESRVLSRDPSHHTLVAYARLSPPVVGQRDYTIRVTEESRHSADGGTIFQMRWEPANELGPAEIKGVARVKVNHGSWLLEPTDGGAATRATYTVLTDGGGGLPAWVINAANKRSVPDLFEAVRKTAKDPKYRTAPATTTP
ncbi:MAG: cyclase/dehydrase [Verrucomicrobia bacterium]|nr:cyclase/dehydrase [Verrucomicrobiota bacterium]